MVAFIPGRAQSGAFVQIISPEGSRQCKVSHLSVRGGVIRADGCRFSRRGCRIRLPGVHGEIRYAPFSPLGSDIMGPFRFFPMECRHGVLSMAHRLQGSVTVDGRLYDFRGGTGYAETDSGTSFPRSYLWVQCNDFPQPCSLMLSIARIPFCGLAFRGCICAILYRGKEYRLATYLGARAEQVQPEEILIRQGPLTLRVHFLSSRHLGLSAPVQGKMSRLIRENITGHAHYQLCSGDQQLLDVESAQASFEYEWEE